MTTSIGKLSKSFFVKLLVGIIILPFVFWGMGDVFRGGNQNVIATIDSKKISTQDFVNYINRLNLTQKQIKNLPDTDLLEQILYASQTLGCLRIFLEVRKSNLTAISLYQKRGFKKLSIRKNYYKLDKSREDAIVMSKNIRNSWKNLFFK